MNSPFVGIVGDDITGSGDIGVMFAKHGYAVRIFGAETDLESLPGRLAGKRTDVVIIDTDGRMDDPRDAYAKVRRATAETVVLEEIAPGLPSSLAPQQAMLLVLKSGSFGGPDFALKAIVHLKQLGGG